MRLPHERSAGLIDFPGGGVRRDWVVEGEDLLFVSRTAHDEAGGPRNSHDANHITFHRIQDFRKKPRA
jgi:hypothetical protein